MENFFTIKEASEYLQIHMNTLYLLAKKGKIPTIKVGCQYRIPKNTLDEMLKGDWLARR